MGVPHFGLKCNKCDSTKRLRTLRKICAVTVPVLDPNGGAQPAYNTVKRLIYGYERGPGSVLCMARQIPRQVVLHFIAQMT